MAVVADSGGIYALYDIADVHHVAVRHAVENDSGPIVVPVAILAELDYMLRTHLGVEAETAFLDDVIKGSFELAPLSAEDLPRCRSLLVKYRNLDLGLADTAVIATAERLKIHRVLTVDQRDYRVVRADLDGPFVVLPYDEAPEPH